MLLSSSLLHSWRLLTCFNLLHALWTPDNLGLVGSIFHFHRIRLLDGGVAWQRIVQEVKWRTLWDFLAGFRFLELGVESWHL